MTHKVLIVGGTFSDVPKPSKLIKSLSIDGTIINGGTLSELEHHANSVVNYDIVIWLPNIDNSVDKFLPQLKVVNPTMTLISSKRVVEKEYTEFDIIGRLLKSKSNLGIMITIDDGRYYFKLLDPLGNEFGFTDNFNDIIDIAIERAIVIRGFGRIPSKSVGERQPFTINDDFISLVNETANDFTKYVNAVNPNRMLGNASTRCMHGFPAQRQHSRLFVSQRNIDKNLINGDGFVEVTTNESMVEYYGNVKPSVDSPIQIQLFNAFPNINYMIHGHVYAKNATMLHHKYPCGAIDEVQDIKSILNHDVTQFAVNLYGHGCLVAANTVENLRSLCNFESRPFPEK